MISSRWRLTLAQRALRTAERHLEAGRMDHFKRSCAFAREQLREYDLDDYASAHDGVQIVERRTGT